MVHRVSRLPKAKPMEKLFLGAAGVGVLAPLYMVSPGADKRLESQTNKWAPRWERNISYFVPHTEKGIQRIEPPVSKMVQKVDEKLPLEKMAKGMESGIKKGISKLPPFGTAPPKGGDV